MADELTPVEAEDTADEPKKKGGLMRKLLVLLVVSLGVGGGGAWWLLRSSADAVAAEAAPPEVALDERGLVTFEPFLVNLSDGGGNRFLKTTVQLVLASVEEAAHVQETPVVLMHLRSAILELLSEQRADDLVTAEGKQQLKDALKERAGAALTPEHVVDVLFSEFVVQF